FQRRGRLRLDLLFDERHDEAIGWEVDRLLNVGRGGLRWRRLESRRNSADVGDAEENAPRAIVGHGRLTQSDGGLIHALLEPQRVDDLRLELVVVVRGRSKEKRHVSVRVDFPFGRRLRELNIPVFKYRARQEDIWRSRRR